MSGRRNKIQLTAKLAAESVVASLDLPELTPAEHRSTQWMVLCAEPGFHYKGEYRTVDEAWIDARISNHETFTAKGHQPVILSEHKHNGLGRGEIQVLAKARVPRDTTEGVTVHELSLLAGVAILDPYPTDQGDVPVQTLIDQGRMRNVSMGLWDIEDPDTGEVLEGVVVESSLTSISHLRGTSRFLTGATELGDAPMFTFPEGYETMSDADKLAVQKAAIEAVLKALGEGNDPAPAEPAPPMTMSAPSSVEALLRKLSAPAGAPAPVADPAVAAMQAQLTAVTAELGAQKAATARAEFAQAYRLGGTITLSAAALGWLAAAYAANPDGFDAVEAAYADPVVALAAAPGTPGAPAPTTHPWAGRLGSGVGQAPAASGKRMSGVELMAKAKELKRNPAELKLELTEQGYEFFRANA